MNWKEKYTPEEMRKAMVSAYCMGNKSDGMRADDIMALFDVNYYDDEMRSFITSKLRMRDENKHMAKARLLNAKNR